MNIPIEYWNPVNLPRTVVNKGRDICNKCGYPENLDDDGCCSVCHDWCTPNLIIGNYSLRQMDILAHPKNYPKLLLKRGIKPPAMD